MFRHGKSLEEKKQEKKMVKYREKKGVELNGEGREKQESIDV